jgi:hypothetical protein
MIRLRYPAINPTPAQPWEALGHCAHRAGGEVRRSITVGLDSVARGDARKGSGRFGLDRGHCGAGGPGGGA